MLLKKLKKMMKLNPLSPIIQRKTEQPKKEKEGELTPLMKKV